MSYSVKMCTHPEPHRHTHTHLSPLHLFVVTSRDLHRQTSLIDQEPVNQLSVNQRANAEQVWPVVYRPGNATLRPVMMHTRPTVDDVDVRVVWWSLLGMLIQSWETVHYGGLRITVGLHVQDFLFLFFLMFVSTICVPVLLCVTGAE